MLLHAIPNLSAQASSEDLINETKLEIKKRFPDVPFVTVQELKELLNSPGDSKPLLIDVRSSAEFEVSHLKNADNCPLDKSLNKFCSDLPQDRKLMVYCSVGYRSAEFVRRLRAQGYVNIYNLEGGIFEWKNQENPVFQGGQEVQQVHPYNTKWGKLLKAQYRVSKGK